MILTEAYERVYGIQDHAADPSPLAHIGLSPVNDVHTFSNLYGKFWRFAESKVGDHFRISFEAYMQLPREYTTLMYEIATSIEARKKPDKELEDLEKQLKDIGA